MNISSQLSLMTHNCHNINSRIMERNVIISISNEDTKEVFFSTDHCQKHDKGSSFVPCTYSLPMNVVPREGIEDGIVDTREKLIRVFYSDFTIIPNPDPKFQG